MPISLWRTTRSRRTLRDGRRFRTLNVLDEGVREGLVIEVDSSLRAKRVGAGTYAAEGVARVAARNRSVLHRIQTHSDTQSPLVSVL